MVSHPINAVPNDQRRTRKQHRSCIIRSHEERRARRSTPYPHGMPFASQQISPKTPCPTINAVPARDAVHVPADRTQNAVPDDQRRTRNQRRSCIIRSRPKRRAQRSTPYQHGMPFTYQQIAPRTRCPTISARPEGMVDGLHPRFRTSSPVPGEQPGGRRAHLSRPDHRGRDCAMDRIPGSARAVPCQGGHREDAVRAMTEAACGAIARPDQRVTQECSTNAVPTFSTVPGGHARNADDLFFPPCREQMHPFFSNGMAQHRLAGDAAGAA